MIVWSYDNLVLFCFSSSTSLRSTRGPFSLEPSTHNYFLVKRRRSYFWHRRVKRLLEAFQGLDGHETLPDESPRQKTSNCTVKKTKTESSSVSEAVCENHVSPKTSAQTSLQQQPRGENCWFGLTFAAQCAISPSFPVSPPLINGTIKTKMPFFGFVEESDLFLLVHLASEVGACSQKSPTRAAKLFITDLSADYFYDSLINLWKKLLKLKVLS